MRPALEVFLAFLRLGFTSFGGPVAHLAFFREEFVARRRWLDDESYADLVALCQFLPGPASSQVGMVLGWRRAGWVGVAAAWLGFTLPSAALMIGFAYAVNQLGPLGSSPLWLGALHGLKVAAVAVVAHAIQGMARSLCPDLSRRVLAGAVAVLALGLSWWPGVGVLWGPLLAIGASGAIGVWVGRRWVAEGRGGADAHGGFAMSRMAGGAALALLALLLAGLPLWAAASGSAWWAQVDGFFRAGALVFGGGHVVLPLLQASVVPTGVVSTADFLAGYGAAQALPGPLFSFSAFLGAVMNSAALGSLAPWQGGLLLLGVTFLPALLVVVGALPFWDLLRERPRMRAAMTGVNAGVVGLLIAAFIDPVWTSAIGTPADVLLAVVSLAALWRWRVSPVWVVLGCACAGTLMASI